MNTESNETNKTGEFIGTAENLSTDMPILDHCARFDCLNRTRLPIGLTRFFKILVLVFFALTAALLILPWQQFIRGQGKVVAFDPKERSITVEAPLSGRVDQIHVVEGRTVQKGDLLFQIVDNDPHYFENLKLQKTSIEGQSQAASEKLERLAEQIKDLESAVPQAITIAEQQVEAAEAALLAAEQQFQRIEKLYNDPRGLVSQREFELATLNRNSNKAFVLRMEAELAKVRLDMNVELEKARASRASAESDFNKVQKELKDIEIKINQTGRLDVSAPRDGMVFRVNVTEGSFVKASVPMCVIIPKSKQLVVEMWVDGNDMPLIRERQVDENGQLLHSGSPVRLQFEGWPAIQFVGWPSVAVGTFGGEVVFVDATDNGQGLFRVLVAPDPDVIPGKEGMMIDWPESPIMRQGVQAQGWVLLERVPLWYEVWRQLNGFPPALHEESSVLKQMKRY